MGPRRIYPCRLISHLRNYGQRGFAKLTTPETSGFSRGNSSAQMGSTRRRQLSISTPAIAGLFRQQTARGFTINGVRRVSFRCDAKAGNRRLSKACKYDEKLRKSPRLVIQFMSSYSAASMRAWFPAEYLNPRQPTKPVLHNPEDYSAFERIIIAPAN